jgi:hypothetical protein
MNGNRGIAGEVAPVQKAIAIRWLIALMVLCCDPLATALTAASAARRSTIA